MAILSLTTIVVFLVLYFSILEKQEKSFCFTNRGDPLPLIEKHVIRISRSLSSSWRA